MTFSEKGLTETNEKHQLGEIIDALEEQRCILILGNYAFSKLIKTDTNEPGASSPQGEEYFLPDLLLKTQKEWPDEDSPDFYTVAENLLKNSGGQRKFMELTDISLEEIGEMQQERLRKVSEIPFDLILSTYPFDLLREVFNKNRIEHDFAYYSYSRGSEELKEPSRKKPLIYNLFGSVEHKQSMVISLEQLYQFMFAVMGARQLPRMIQDKVSQATHLVFMGFSFDDWYMKLLLRILKVHEKKNSFAHPSKAYGMGVNNRLFFENNFRVTFLDKRVDEFVDALHNQCEEEGKLRLNTMDSGDRMFKELNQWVIQYRLDEVLEKLDDELIKHGKEAELLKKLGDFQLNFHDLKKRAIYDPEISKQELEEKQKTFRDNLSSFIEEVKLRILT